ncbi:MAG: serine hydrolase domain-containing protein [Acidobacteriota bacterium]
MQPSTILDYYFGPSGPGAALAVAADGREPHFQCRGVADLATGRPITADTVFDLASASKPFTAAAVLRLAERGDLDLDAEAHLHLPCLEPSPTGRGIRIRDLLAHTSDLPDYLAEGMFTDPADTTPDSVLARLPAWSRDARPGLRFDYSNTNYVALAWLVEEISGVSFAAFVDRELTAPLGLDSTFVLDAETSHRLRTIDGALGYRDDGYGLSDYAPSDDFPVTTVGDGNVHSSLRDLVRWQGALFAGEVLAPKTLEGMLTPGRTDDGGSFPYGLGMQVENRTGTGTWWGHGGSWTQSTTLVGRYHGAGISVVVLSNETMAPVERLSRQTLAAWRASEA